MEKENVEIELKIVEPKKLFITSKSERAKLRRKGVIEIGEKGEERKALIQEKLSRYGLLQDFIKDNLNDYKWAYYNGLKEEMFGHFPDYIRKIKYKAQKESRDNEDEKRLRKAKRNASVSRTLEEYERRFRSSYEYALEKNILDQMTWLFKKD